MWYEIIPSFVIVTLSIWIPGAILPKYMHLWDTGNAYGRDAIRADMRHYLQRDQSKQGSVYQFAGLEALKTENNATSKK